MLESTLITSGFMQFNLPRKEEFRFEGQSQVLRNHLTIESKWRLVTVNDARTPGAALARRVLRTRTDIRLGYKYHATDHFLFKSRQRLQADEYLTSWVANILLWTTTRSSTRAARGAPSRPCVTIPYDPSMSSPAQVSLVYCHLCIKYDIHKFFSEPI